jgi:hypothetical protein
MKDTRPTLRTISKEIFSKGYLRRAHKRADRRKSLWNVPCVVGGFLLIGVLWRTLLHAMWYVHTLFYPEHAGSFSAVFGNFIGDSSPRISDASFPCVLLEMPLLFASIPLGFLIANFIMWCIPPARKAMDREAQGIKWGTFVEAQAFLFKIVLIVVPSCLVLSFIGAVTLRHL